MSTRQFILLLAAARLAASHSSQAALFESQIHESAFAPPGIAAAGGPPVIVTQPVDQVVSQGAPAQFRISTEGSPPLSYQWYQNGAEIAQATNDYYAISATIADDAGLYCVLVSNSFGSVTSYTASLKFMTAGEAINYPNPSLVLDHTPPWFVEGAVSHDGVAALQTGSRNGAEKCDVRLAFVGPGKLTFWWKLDSADALADISFGFDGIDSHVLRGTAPWKMETIYVAAGSHVAEWTFHLNNSTVSPVGWLDEVSYLPGGQPPSWSTNFQVRPVVEGTNLLLRAPAGGTAPLRYQWQFAGENLPGATNSSLRLPNVRTSQAGIYTLWASNAYGAAGCQIELFVNPSAPVVLPRRPCVLSVAGGDAALRADVIGTPPFSYQWLCEGEPIPGATNSILHLYGLETEHAGRYSVVVSNALGASEGPPVELALSKVSRVIHISVDGLGSRWLETAFREERERYPNLVRFQDEGTSTCNARCDFTNSVTVPNHATMLTGRPVLKPLGWADTAHHGYTDDGYPLAGTTLHNSGNLAAPYKASVFDVIHDYGLSTALLASKSKFVLFTDSYNAANGAPDLVPPDNGRGKIDYGYAADSSSVDVVNRLLAAMTNGTLPEYTFLHFSDPDITGHAQGWGTSAYYDTLEQVDSQLGRLLAAVENHPDSAVARETAVILTADHGGGGSAGVGGTSHSTAWRPVNFTIPFFALGPGFPAGADFYSCTTNRFNPGTNYPDYAAPQQPLRNGDSANLALSLLNLPLIPGSSLIPLLSPARLPAVAWPTPPALTFGQPLGADHLNAATTIPGTMVYDPPSGAILEPGQHILTAVFLPTDSYAYQTATSTVSLTVLLFNSPPLAGPDELNTMRGQPVLVDVSSLLANDTDPDGDPLTVTAVLGQTTRQGLARLTNQVIEYTPPQNFIGDDWFQYVITDKHDHWATGSVHVVVRPWQTLAHQRLLPEKPTGSGCTLLFVGTPGQIYELEFTESFDRWTALATILVGPSIYASYTDPESVLSPHRFYRLRLADRTK